MTPFVHLHTHTAYSIKDAVGKIDEYLDKAKKDGQTAIAFTEHGNMYSHIDGYFKAKEKGLKFIFGLEAYTVRNRFARGYANCLPGEEKRLDAREHPRNKKRAWHLILLAENLTGYKNLLKLVSESSNQFYYNPRIDKEILAKYSEGLIATSACLGGEVNQALSLEDFDWAEEAIKGYIDIFGRDRFFLEIQDHGIPEQLKINKFIPRFAKKFDLRVVATNDVHFLNKEDKIVQDALKALDDGLVLESPELQKKLFKSDQGYLKTQAEMAEVFKDNPEWLEASYEIAQRCNVELKHDKVIFPEFSKGESQENKKAKLRELCVVGWKDLIENKVKDESKRKEYGDRVKYEIDVIANNGFVDYFLIIQDIMRFTRERKIPTSRGRGSVGGSLVAYLLKITKIDPIKYDLYFERFLNPARISPPDIDLDFADDRRDEVIEYTKKKYGAENFAKTITFGNFQPKMALRDSLRVYGYDLDTQSKISKLIPDVIQGIPNIRFKHLYGQDPSFPEAIQPELLKVREQYPEVFKLAEKLEGNPRQPSTHASAYVLTDLPIIEYAPLDWDAKNKELRIGIDMYAMEKVKLLKMDFLGIETLAIVDNALKEIEKRHGEKIDLDEISLENETTWGLASKGDTVGIFQFESEGMRGLLKKARPKNIDELADCNGIFRPGAAKFIKDYCDVKNGLKEPSYFHALMEPILKNTFSVMIYQEQVMKMCTILAGFTLPEADYMRKAIGKKKQEDMAKLIPMFEKGCLKNGIDKDLVTKILDWFHDMSRYNFNKSHAIAYALNAYDSAYIKSNYPLEFSKNMLNKKNNDLEKYQIKVGDTRKRGIKVYGPSVNKSLMGCSYGEGNSIYFGLDLIKGTGSDTLKKIIRERESGKFVDYTEFLTRCKEFIDKNTVQGLILSGALDELHINRMFAYTHLETHLKDLKKSNRNKNQMALFEDLEKEQGFNGPTGSDDFDDFTKLEQEKSVIGFYASSSPLDKYRKFLLDDDVYDTSQVSGLGNQEMVKIGALVKDFRKFKDKNGNDMATFNIEDEFGTARCLLFSKKYNRFKSKLKEKLPVIIEGMTNNGAILVDSMEKLEALCES